MRNATSEYPGSPEPRKRNRRARRIAPSAARQTITEENLGTELRRAFFARGGEIANRYSITLQHVLAHVEVAEEVARKVTSSQACAS